MAKFELVFTLTLEETFSQSFISKPTERAKVLLKNGTRDFQIVAPFERPPCFSVTISGNFKCFQCCNFETKFSGKRTPLSRNWSNVLYLKVLKLKTHHFHTKLPCQKPMLRQIE